MTLLYSDVSKSFANILAFCISKSFACTQHTRERQFFLNAHLNGKEIRTHYHYNEMNELMVTIWVWPGFLRVISCQQSFLRVISCQQSKVSRVKLSQTSLTTHNNSTYWPMGPILTSTPRTWNNVLLCYLQYVPTWKTKGTFHGLKKHFLVS